jgi:uncharacterized protein DUF4214
VAAGQRAKLSDFTTEITPAELGRHLFIACVPKSASTFLKNLLVNVTGYRDLFTVYAAGQSEHEIYLPTLRESAHLDTVTQQHCRASDANVHLMQGFGIRPVVLVRNIFDSVMSLLDFYNQGAFQTSFARADWMVLDEETKIDLLIENVIPWYFQFVASEAFVLMEYFGYLQRDPDAVGYQHWLDKLNFYGNYNDAEMVKSFIASPEYRARFGQP